MHLKSASYNYGAPLMTPWWQAYMRTADTRRRRVPLWTPSPHTEVTIVGKNELYNRRNLVGPFVVHNIFRPRPRDALDGKGRDLRSGPRGGWAGG